MKQSLAQQLEPGFNRVIAELPNLEAQITYIQDEFMKHALLGLLEDNHGNVRAASRQADMHWDSLWNLLRKHNVDPSVYVNEYTYICPDLTENLPSSPSNNTTNPARQ